MLEGPLRRVLRAIFGGGADISSANPLPVDTSPGSKTVSEIMDEASIAIGATTVLADCDAIDLTSGPSTLAITVEAQYNAAATLGIRLHVRTSPTSVAAGTHTGPNNQAMLTDANAHFVANELVGLTIQNTTDGSSATITANTATTVTGVLAGGTDNDWDTGDVYSIAGANYDTDDWDTWNPNFAAGAFLRQTVEYDTDPAYVKVLVENRDAAQTVTDVKVIATVGP